MAETKRWWRRWSLILPVVVLTAAAALQGIGVFREVPKTRGPHVAELVPTSLPGWRVRNVPLGPTEFMTGQVEKTLNFDEAVSREYSRAGATFGVYVAYWGAGKMPTRLVASHTPDRCWTENGWTCQEMRFRQPLAANGAALQPAEWRRFLPPNGGATTYVLYWHLVEGQVYDQGGRFNAVPDPLAWWKDAVQQALLGSREQYFIRLTANVPLETLWADPGLGEVLRGLQALGLGTPHPVAVSP